MTGALARQRCRIHAEREAAGRCPSCRRFFCKECVTEHDGRMLCAECLSAAAAPRAGRSGTRWALWTAAALLGLLASFLLFYTAGYILQQAPTEWPAEGEAEL